MSMLGFLEGFNVVDIFIEIVNLIPKLMYFLAVMAMALLDVAQLVLRKIAGLDYYYVGNSAEPQTGDIALQFIQSIFDSNTAYPAIRNAFWSLMIIAVLLLIITTIISVIRQEYMPGEQELRERPTNSKTWVMFRAMRALFLFLIVPVSVIFGLMFADILLKAFDSATTGGVVGGVLFSTPGVTEKLEATEVLGSDGEVSYTNFDFFGFNSATTNVTYSGLIFKSSAYMANRVRINKVYATEEAGTTVERSFYELVVSDQDYINNFGIFNLADTKEETAQMMDEAFAANVILKNPEELITDNPVGSNVSTLVFTEKTVTSFSKFNVGLVWYFYDLWQFNYIVAFAFIFVSLRLFINIVGGLMKRIIELIALFLISPPIIGVFPLDNGKAFSQWRQVFMGRALQAFGAIIGMNVFFLILPYLNEIKFISAVDLNVYGAESVAFMVNTIISTLFMVVGLTTVEGFIKLLSGFTGSESAAEVGKDVVGKTGDTIAKSAKWTGAAAGVATAPYKLAGKLGGRLGMKIGRGISNTKGGKALGEKLKKGIGLTKKKAEEISENFQNSWNQGGADSAFGDYINSNMQSNQAFAADMNNAYENRKDGKNLNQADWLKTKEGMQAAGKLGSAYNMQNRVDFRDAKTGAGAEAYSALLEKKMLEGASYKEAATARLSAVMSAPVIGDAINGTLEVGKHLSSYASNVPILFEEGFQRERKQGFKSMLMAFQGKTAKEIELEEIYTSQKAQESQKAKIQEQEREKAAKKNQGKEDFDDKNKNKLDAKEFADLGRRVKALENEKNKK